ncbi:hypothetical protein HUG10_13455 [Halorarum halophilum]|uniref:Uncharacterized protein n=1 Tax=Halorarum halophilum TaxID=2743090 RepID=A0A7D5KMM9_9EURY|nr:hypothetical protein [Halobaculum halophilum]QLG28495.1 hypothetical protein HUG10_13455 [Halobaculum halophilum]
MVLDLLGEAVAANPVLTAILVVMIALLLGAYLFVRRILVSAKEGYRAGQSER